MTQTQYRQRIERELESLNSLIDERIVRGLSYRAEARRHKELIRQARRMRRPSLLARLMPVLSMSLF